MPTNGISLANMENRRAYKDILDARNYVGKYQYIVENGIRVPSLYMGEELFPLVKQIGNSLHFIKGANAAPVVLALSEPGAKTIYRGNEEIEISETTMPLFKEGSQLDEVLLYELVNLRSNINEDMYNKVLDRVFDSGTRLLLGARATREKMAMEVLSTGKINLSDNGAKFSMDYNVKNQFTITDTAKKWDSPDAEILEDILKWKEAANISGAARAICNRKLFNKMAKNMSIREIASVTNKFSFVSPEMVKQVIYDYTEVDLVINDYAYEEYTKKGTLVTKYFYPDDKFTIIPMASGAIGEMRIGMTMEEAVLKDVRGHRMVDVVDDGVVLVLKESDDPVTVMMKTTMCCAPSLPIADQIVIAKVV